MKKHRDGRGLEGTQRSLSVLLGASDLASGPFVLFRSVMSIAETPGGGGFVRGHVGNTIRDQQGRTPTDPVSHTTSVICCSIRMPSQRFLLWSTCVAVALVPAQAFLPVGQAPVASPPRPLYSTLQAPPKPTSATKIKQLKEEILSLVAVPEAEDNAVSDAGSRFRHAKGRYRWYRG